MGQRREEKAVVGVEEGRSLEHQRVLSTYHEPHHAGPFQGSRLILSSSHPLPSGSGPHFIDKALRGEDVIYPRACSQNLRMGPAIKYTVPSGMETGLECMGHSGTGQLLWSGWRCVCAPPPPPAPAPPSWAPCVSPSMGFFQTRDQTHVPCIGRRILYHQATREVPTC